MANSTDAVRFVRATGAAETIDAIEPDDSVSALAAELEELLDGDQTVELPKASRFYP